MKIKIQRSFSKRVQLRQFEPIEASCTVEAETELETLADQEAADVSLVLEKFCREEVEKTLNQFKAIDT